ncbi:MAG TPA: hypothetical protein VFE24_08310, partial [Pirellulales bacterium]|nr:hypothetical protein [Pirellulales bacterium]
LVVIAAGALFLWIIKLAWYAVGTHQLRFYGATQQIDETIGIVIWPLSKRTYSFTEFDNIVITRILLGRSRLQPPAIP